LTDNPSPTVENPAPAPQEAPRAARKNTVSSNPARVKFPRDLSGTYAPLRKELLLAVSRIRGNSDKQKLFMETLGVAAQHSLARIDKDADRVTKAVERREVYARAQARTIVSGA
jgi:hypothetical protein